MTHWPGLLGTHAKLTENWRERSGPGAAETAASPLEHEQHSRDGPGEPTELVLSDRHGHESVGAYQARAGTNAGVHARVAKYLLVAKGAHLHALDGPAL